MASVQRTPGVYREEISLFPPSVAAVETAVPVFIGYTVKAENRAQNDLRMKAFEISSIAEFREKYGEGPEVNVEAVHLDPDNAVLDVDLESDYYLYDSLRMFYANGGGKCFVVSVGGFDDEVSDSALKAGLGAAALEDQITMLVMPDAITLADDRIYGVQQAALQQCGKLLDRFAIFDLLEFKDDVALSLKESRDDFREAIGTSNLKYGAAYVPHLRVNLPKTVAFRNVRNSLKKLGQQVNAGDLVPKLKDGTTDPSLTEVNSAIDDVATVRTAISAYVSSNRANNSIKTIDEVFVAAYDDFRNASTALLTGDATNNELTTTGAAFQTLFDLTYLLIQKTVDAHAIPNANNALKNTSLRAFARTQIDTFMRAEVRRLNSMTVDATNVAGTPNSFVRRYTDANFAVGAANAHWGNAYSATLQAPTGADLTAIYPNDVQNLADSVLRRAQGRNMVHAAKQVLGIFETVHRSSAAILAEANEAEAKAEEKRLDAAPQIRNVIREVTLAESTLPSSGVMAGIYSRVDGARGVFKAPANESLNNVAGLTRVISHEEQGELNVDALAGKSINAIRPFLGRGKLVWGARTLDGNSNEWRYISVRRFFNMVEESCKNASERFVFEPNDKNTWVKVRGMIENFLLVQWRAGALQGAVPEDAFFVNVGLGETMTALDVLEGRMIVEIGMAVVRPAEFIILRFSHKMPVS
ncbi:MAG: phage tail sheath family protein [Betaproteobacteria bacterium]|nr:MAG: phage tail sheath family protein [Betaproteobacteria bacterium]